MRRRKESQQDKINLSCLSLHLNPSLLKYLVFSPAITTTERQTSHLITEPLPPLGPMPSTLPSSDSIIPGAHPDFDLEALRAIATQTRSEKCHHGNRTSGRGMFSFMVPLPSDDGVERIAKCPARCAIEIPEIRKMAVESEVATLRLVRYRTTIPVPDVIAWDSSGNNPVGNAYILISRATGRCLNDCGWYSWLSKDDTESMTREQKCKIYS